MNRTKSRSCAWAVAIACVYVGASVSAYAQLGKLKDLRRAVKKEAENALGNADQEQAGGKQSDRPPARKDKDRKYPPGLSFSTVLNGIQLLAKNGKLSLHNIQGTFLPGDGKDGLIVLRTADGKELYEFVCQVQTLKKPYFLLSISKKTDLRTGQQVSGSVDFATPGDYVLDFHLPTEHFYTFPFSVAKIGSDEAFGDGECFTLNGAWQDWGYLYYRDAKPDQNLQWKVWLRNDGCDEKSIKVRVEIKRDQDGELVCTSRENTTYSVQPKWSRREFDMVFPKGKEVPHGTYFKAKDLLDTDGTYTLTMKIDDQPYGTWKFAIEGGKLNYTGRTLRGKADPLTFVEGGRDAWWYAKEK